MNTLSENSTESEFQEYTVLIVDDNPANLSVLTDYLEDNGFEIMAARDGKTGLEMAHLAQPDIILLDVMMPGIDGFETCRRFKTSDTTKEIPVIFMTALTSLEDKVKGFEVGGVDYITKPIQHEEVLARLTTHLRIRELTQKLQIKTQEVIALNERLTEENFRMSAELDVTRRLQQMVLPKEQELKQITELDIASFMEPAHEVGGDYYDVLEHNGNIKIGIGDVTGHGLESGVLMLMVQTAVRTLLNNNVTDPENFLKVINRTIYDNMQRLCSDKNLTLSLLDYRAGRLRLTGQHEEVLVVRKGGAIERIDTFDLGFMVGVEADIAPFISQIEISLRPGDGIVLYTDGITEARNIDKKLYGLKQLCEVISQNWHLSAYEIQKAVIADVRQHIGTQKVSDDITLLVVKQK
jgi:two-component system, sensor histidine kinase ChiS